MRKIISIAFIAVLFINLFGYFISFTVQRSEIRAEVKQLMKQEKMKHTQQFVFTEQGYQKLNKLEGGKEFTLDGGLYDVVKKERVGGKIILTAYYDHQETGLLGEFVSYFNDDTQSEKGKHTLPFFTLLEFIFDAGEWRCHPTSVCFNIPSYDSNLHTVSLDSVTPPPDTLFC